VGDGLFDSLGRLFASSDTKAVRGQLQPFLDRCASQFSQAPTAFRKACLAELHGAREKGLLSAANVFSNGPARLAPAFAADTKGAADDGHRAVSALADDLAPHCPNLATLLRQPTPSGQPLLAAAFAFFLRREVVTNEELSRGLAFDGMRQASAE
jgi:hypothetical protein